MSYLHHQQSLVMYAWCLQMFESGWQGYCRSVSRHFLRNKLTPPYGQEYKGKLSFATDAWTSPNHKAFVAVTVHFEQEGKPLCLLLDIVEVPKVRAHL